MVVVRLLSSKDDHATKDDHAMKKSNYEICLVRILLLIGWKHCMSYECSGFRDLHAIDSCGRFCNAFCACARNCSFYG